MTRGGRVGSLDDPIWHEPPPPAGRRAAGAKVFSRGKKLSILGVVAVAVATGMVVWHVRSRQGGDSGNLVYDELKNTLIAAVPPGATDAGLGAATPTHWTSGCATMPHASSGWSQVRLSVTFSDTGSRTLVTDQLGVVLGRNGWTRRDARPGPQQGKIAHWFKEMPAGDVADIFAYPFGGPNGWSMTASWQPPGPVGQPCP